MGLRMIIDFPLFYGLSDILSFQYKIMIYWKARFFNWFLGFQAQKKCDKMETVNTPEMRRTPYDTRRYEEHQKELALSHYKG